MKNWSSMKAMWNGFSPTFALIPIGGLILFVLMKVACPFQPSRVRCPGGPHPKQPAGLQTASSEAIRRWQADAYKFQVYQYEARHLVRRYDGQLRTPSLMEREKLMGFPAGYVSVGFSPKLTLAEAFVQGACMIGNSFNVCSITFLLDELLKHHDQAHRARQLDRILVRDDSAPPAWCDHPAFDSTSKPDEHSRMLVQEFLRQGDRGGH